MDWADSASNVEIPLSQRERVIELSQRKSGGSLDFS
jgi:hypothetical protein